MKIVTLAALTASFFALAIPGAEASMRHHSSGHMMMRSHHMHMMHRSGRMPASRNF